MHLLLFSFFYDFGGRSGITGQKFVLLGKSVSEDVLYYYLFLYADIGQHKEDKLQILQINGEIMI